MIATKLLPELEKRLEIIKDFRLQFDFMLQRINVESVLIDKNQKELFLRGFSQGKDTKISSVEDFYLFLKNSKTDIASLDLIGESSASSEFGSDLSGFIIEADTRTIVFSWLVDPESTNSNQIALEG